MRPAPRLISDSAHWPKITAAIEDGTKQRIMPQITLATALLLVCGGAPHSGCAVAACGTGCDTPQYGHTGTKSARFPWQFVHCFKNVSPARGAAPAAPDLRRECIWKLVDSSITQ